MPLFYSRSRPAVKGWPTTTISLFFVGEFEGLFFFARFSRVCFCSIAETVPILLHGRNRSRISATALHCGVRLGRVRVRFVTCRSVPNLDA